MKGDVMKVMKAASPEPESVSFHLSSIASVGGEDRAAAIRHELEDGLAGFKKLMAEADAQAIRAGGILPAPAAERVHAAVLRLFHELNRLIGDDAPLSPAVRHELGRYFQRELLPYVSMSQNGDRYYSKPRGYAGDFLMIDRMYENRPTGTGRLGPALDAAFLDTPTCHAVRNRRTILAAEISRELDAHPERPVGVASLACGPARELFDVYETLADKTRLVTTLVDIDFQALALVSERCDRAGLRKQMRIKQSNLVHLALGRDQLILEPQDLVYSIGLIDYFGDKFVVLLLDLIHGLLRPGGRVVLGNFHPRNSMKAGMDYLFEWKLIHRNEDDLNRLFAASAFRQPCTRIQNEEQGINLFAECVRAS